MVCIKRAFIPQVIKRSNPNKVLWWSKQVKAVVTEKQKAFKRYKVTDILADYNFYKICRNKAKDVIRQARLNYESKLIANIDKTTLFLQLYKE